MRRSRTALRDEQRGAAFVELVFVVPILMALVLGMLEVGVAWRDSVTVSTASRNGARALAQLATDDQADREALRAALAVFGADADRIELVIVYESDGSGQVPTPCFAGSTSYCNRYTPVELAELAVDGRWGCGAGTNDDSYCPTSRDRRAQTADHVGVYVQFDRPMLTGIFGGGSYTLDETTVMRLEPSVTTS